MLKKSDPIGVFDSGLGGITVWKRVSELLPAENIIYYGDSMHCPYGPRSVEEINLLTSKAVEYLLEKRCKAIVVACNTATAAAIDNLRATYGIEFIGMEPAVKPASINSKTSAVGVLATIGTLNGRLFNETSRKYASDVELVVQVGEGLVELVERGEYRSEEAYRLIRKYIKPMVDRSVDHIVLGCTHYPFYSEIIGELTEGKIDVLDPAPAVAKQLKRKLEESGLVNESNQEPKYEFFFTGEIEAAQRLIKDVTDCQVTVSQV